MTIELGVSTLFCLHKHFKEAVKETMLFGTRCVELTDEGLHALSQARVELLLELKASYDLRYALHAPFADVNIAAYDDFIREAVLKRLEASIRWASALEVEVMVYHPGSITVLEQRYPGKAWKLNLEAVLRLQNYAHEHGVMAMIENVPDPFPFIMKSIENFERFYDEVEVDVRMVLDIAHANLRGETEEFLRRFHDKIGHIHVSDNNGRFDEHLRLGEGSIDWGGVVADVKASGFQGWVVIESFDGIDESLRLLSGTMDCI
jgi:sugar phosphate isomerase/epimerase